MRKEHSEREQIVERKYEAIVPKFSESKTDGNTEREQLFRIEKQSLASFRVNDENVFFCQSIEE